jgi:hypothetical protein
MLHVKVLFDVELVGTKHSNRTAQAQKPVVNYGKQQNASSSFFLQKNESVQNFIISVLKKRIESKESLEG